MPYDTVNRAWVEQTLRTTEWQLWLEVVEKMNPVVVTASRRLDTWLGADCLIGGPISQYRAPLRFETIGRVGQVQDSEEEEEEPSSQDGGALPSSIASATNQELSLDDLFTVAE